jgi:hypothetical protein
MHTRRSITALVLGILVIIGVGVALVSSTGTPGTTSQPALVADVTPPGWVPVDFGNAQVSVPADWNITYNEQCAIPVGPGTIYVPFRADVG